MEGRGGRDGRPGGERTGGMWFWGGAWRGGRHKEGEAPATRPGGEGTARKGEAEGRCCHRGSVVRWCGPMGGARFSCGDMSLVGGGSGVGERSEEPDEKVPLDPERKLFLGIFL